MILGLPSPTNASAGNMVHEYILRFINAVNTRTGISPTMASRFAFLLGMCVYNAAVYINGGVDKTLKDGFPGTPTGFTFALQHPDWTEAWDTMLMDYYMVQIMQKLAVYLPTINMDDIRILHQQHLTILLDYQQSQNMAVLDPEIYESAAHGFGEKIEAYLLQRDEDGWKQASNHKPFANDGYYISVGGGPDVCGSQDLNTELPAPDEWAPIEYLDNNGRVIRRQSYVTPTFFNVRNWFSDDDWTYIYNLADQFYPDSATFNQQVLEQQNLSATLTDEQKIIAEVHAGSEPRRSNPPMKWMILLAITIASHQMTVQETAQMVGAATTGLFHAGIAAWAVKYKYMQPRPIQIIREYFYGETIDNWNGPTNGACWLPYQLASNVTPAFPDFISGHSTFSAACASIFCTILRSDNVSNGVMVSPLYSDLFSPIFRPNVTYKATALISDQTVFQGASLIQPGTVPANTLSLPWPTWSYLAQQIGMSREYGGIHWHNSNVGGSAVGRAVAQFVLQQFF